MVRRNLVFLTCIFALVGFLLGYHPGEYPLVNMLAIMVLAAPSYYFFVKDNSWQPLVLLAVYGFLFEAQSMVTGVPYGAFGYGTLLGPTVLGAPLTLLFAYPPLVIGVMHRFKGWMVPVMLVLVDLCLDPMAVTLGYWAWDVPGVYYGVPLVNFAGWLISGTIAYYIMRKHTFSVQCSYTLFFSMIFWITYGVTVGLYVPALFGVLFLSLLGKNYYKELYGL